MNAISPARQELKINRKFNGNKKLNPGRLETKNEQTPTGFLKNCSKLDFEPNPFESSFKEIAGEPQILLPPLSTMTPPISDLDWNDIKISPIINEPTLKYQPKSAKKAEPVRKESQPKQFKQPSLSAKNDAPYVNRQVPQPTPQNTYPPVENKVQFVQEALQKVPIAYTNQTYQQQLPPQPSATPVINTDFLHNVPAQLLKKYTTNRKGVGGRKRKPTDNMDDKRIKFLERNRKAALKCRERKKQMWDNLEMKKNLLNMENVKIEEEIMKMKNKILEMRQLLISHAACPRAISNGVLGFESLPPSLVDANGNVVMINPVQSMVINSNFS